MKTALVIAYILIIVLAIAAFLQWRTIKKMMPASAEQNGSSTREVSAGQWTEALSEHLKSMNVELKF